MDLPPDKAKLLKSYDDNRKWEIILDQVCNAKMEIYIWINYLLGFSFLQFMEFVTEWNVHLGKSDCQTATRILSQAS